MSMNRAYSAEDRRAQPSTMFVATDTAARRNWDYSPTRSAIGKDAECRYTLTANASAR